MPQSHLSKKLIKTCKDLGEDDEPFAKSDSVAQQQLILETALFADHES